MASEHHFAAAFKNNCVARPRHPDSNLPLTNEEALLGETLAQNRSSVDKEKMLLFEKELDEDMERNRSDLNGNESAAENDSCHSQIIDNDLKNLLHDNVKFYKHLKSLRLENKKTLKMLERFHRSKPDPQDCSSEQSKDFVVKMKNEVEKEKEELFANKVYDVITNPDEERYSNDSEFRKESNGYWKSGMNSVDLSSSESEEDPRKDWPRIYSQNVLPDDEDEDFRGREFSYQVIDGMWEDFSVENYAPVEKGAREEESPHREEWKPSVTIPKPFQMTLREAAKAKVKSKRMEKLEQELLNKKIAEEAEMNKKFRARPLPAATFMRLYHEQQAEEELKREHRKSLNKAILEATQRPFNFTKREEEKKERRRHNSMEGLSRTAEKKSDFKAQPFPEKLFNLSLEDRIAEQNEYRKIKMKMRAEELLASSSLPPNMQARGERYSANKRYSKRRDQSDIKKTKSRSFRPNINHDIPDYDELHRKFEIDLIRKRREKSPTVCEPFDLHTAKIPTRRLRATTSVTPEMQERSRGRSRERSYQFSARYNSSSLTRGSISDEGPPFAMTETARLRHSMKEATLAKKAMAEEEERKKAAKKKRREEQLRQQVTRKSIHNDMKHVLEKQNKETLKRFRESEIERKRAYKEYLKEVKAKVDQRPLLFEQESQTNAKKAAQRKYRQILKEAGVDEDILDSLVTDDGGIVGAESEDDTEDLLLDVENETDQSGFSSREQKSHDTVVLNDTEDDECDSTDAVADLP